MRKQLIQLFCVIFAIFYVKQISANQNDITLKQLVLGGKEEFHLRILEAIPENGQITTGSNDAENVIIEFFDYKCGYCVKMHPELIDIAEKRDDTKIVFLQLPILSEFSAKLSRLVLAANYQDKGFELHNAILTQKGSITEEKVSKIIEELEIDTKKIKEDLNRTEIEDSLHLTSFIAQAIGVRGTPAVFINNEFNPGYVPKDIVEKLLK
ncbi:MAG: hypothetical protein CMI92_01685 [Pelagibacteraceae bacterium]|nr:hypothetical protein [Pelagibacteraceae bacterium]|tara:strand:+ start:1051 stop:1680 length:630 start_codon:yes stop_codon:yes gene_type:complete